MSNVHRSPSVVNIPPPRHTGDSRKWVAGALAVLVASATVLVTAGCGVSPAQPRGPVPLYLAFVVAMVVMGVRGMARTVADLLREVTQLLVRLVRLALLLVFIAATVIIVGALAAASLIDSIG